MIIYKVTQSTPMQNGSIAMISSYITPRTDKCAYYATKAMAEARAAELNAAVELLGTLDTRISIEEINVIE